MAFQGHRATGGKTKLAHGGFLYAAQLVSIPSLLYEDLGRVIGLHRIYFLVL